MRVSTVWPILKQKDTDFDGEPYCLELLMILL